MAGMREAGGVEHCLAIGLVTSARASPSRDAAPQPARSTDRRGGVAGAAARRSAANPGARAERPAAPAKVCARLRRRRLRAAECRARAPARRGRDAPDRRARRRAAARARAARHPGFQRQLRANAGRVALRECERKGHGVGAKLVRVGMTRIRGHLPMRAAKSNPRRRSSGRIDFFYAIGDHRPIHQWRQGGGGVAAAVFGAAAQHKIFSGAQRKRPRQRRRGLLPGLAVSERPRG